MSSVLHTARGLRKDDASQAHAATVDVSRGMGHLHVPHRWPCSPADLRHYAKLCNAAADAVERQTALAPQSEAVR